MGGGKLTKWGMRRGGAKGWEGVDELGGGRGECGGVSREVNG